MPFSTRLTIVFSYGFLIILEYGIPWPMAFTLFDPYLSNKAILLSLSPGPVSWHEFDLWIVLKVPWGLLMGR